MKNKDIQYISIKIKYNLLEFVDWYLLNENRSAAEHNIIVTIAENYNDVYKKTDEWEKWNMREMLRNEGIEVEGIRHPGIEPEPK